MHVAGWALALARMLETPPLGLRGARDSALEPPQRSPSSGRASMGPGDLRLPGGRVPHDFLRPDGAGRLAEVEHFETVRPDATLEIPASRVFPAPGDATRTVAMDVMVELDDRLSGGAIARKLARYDHFLAGWSMHSERYGRRQEALAIVVFVCRDRTRARECARYADGVLRACRAYAGQYPFDWDYLGRERILFASERDVHGGSLDAYGVPRVPPEVRVQSAHGDPRAGEARVEARTLLNFAPPSSV